jgi:hypothetical protein
MTSTVETTSTAASLSSLSGLSPEETAYHVSRAQICAFLAGLFPLRTDGEHAATKGFTTAQGDLDKLVANLPAQQFPKDLQNKSLLDDVRLEEPIGQVAMALEKTEFWTKWGVHFLPSLQNAHHRQLCNSFKDAGPLQYGVDSPLFIRCRDRLNDAFDNLPAPKPSLTSSLVGGSIISPPSMRSYRNVYGPCFAASTPVQLASGRSLPIRRLRKGMAVLTPLGPRRVVSVLKTPVVRHILCRVGSLLVTPWHPISTSGRKSWVFPARMANAPVRYTGAVFSVLLQPDGNSGAHAMKLGGFWGVTLGHGVVSGRDVRAHTFLGDYCAVKKGLDKLKGSRGVVLGGGVRRDERTGLVCGFLPYGGHA